MSDASTEWQTFITRAENAGLNREHGYATAHTSSSPSQLAEDVLSQVQE